MKEDHVSTSEEDDRGPAATAGADGNGVNPGSKRLGSSSSSSCDSSEDPVMESPSVQLMERKSDAKNEENGHYRFPSSVFSQTKSNAAMEWSINSNESLFSIHMGNMSFNNDLYWIAKSDELGSNGEPLMSPYPPLPDLPPPPTAADCPGHQQPNTLPGYTQPNPNTPPEGGKRNTKLDEGLCAIPEAVETMKSIPMENSGQKKESVSAAEGPSSANLHCRSNETLDSTTSFAIPILTGKHSSKKNRESPHKPREGPDVESSKTQTPKADSAPTSSGQAKWFGCLSCCSGGTS